MSKQASEENYNAFVSWVKERYICNDWNNYIRGSQLNKSEICSECGFSRNVFKKRDGNPKIRDEITRLEVELLSKGILKEKIVNDVEKIISAKEQKNAIRDIRLQELESEVSLLKAKNERLERMLGHMKETGVLLR